MSGGRRAVIVTEVRSARRLFVALLLASLLTVSLSAILTNPVTTPVSPTMSTLSLGFSTVNLASEGSEPSVREYGERPVIIEVFAHEGGTIHDLVEPSALPLFDGQQAIPIVWHPSPTDPLLFPAATERAEDLNASAGEVYIDGVNTTTPLKAANIPGPNQSASFSISATATRSGTTNSNIEVQAEILTHQNASMAAVIQWIILEELIATGDHPLAARDDFVAIAYRFDTNLNRTASGVSDVNISLTEENLAALGVDASNTGPLSVVALVRDITTYEVLGATLATIPDPKPPADSSTRLSAILLLLLTVAMAFWMVLGERSREAAMPRFSAQSERRATGGMSYRIVARAGSRGLEVKEVKATPPWRVGGRGPRFELAPYSEAVHDIRLNRSGDTTAAIDDAPLTHWSIEVEGFGAWVIDLRFRTADEEE